MVAFVLIQLSLKKFSFSFLKVDGGSIISVKISWSQKLLYKDSQYSLNIPFNFPEYVTPVVKKISKKEKIQLNVNAGPGTEVLCKTVSHPLKVHPWFSISFCFNVVIYLVKRCGNFSSDFPGSKAPCRKIGFLLWIRNLFLVNYRL